MNIKVLLQYYYNNTNYRPHKLAMFTYSIGIFMTFVMSLLTGYGKDWRTVEVKYSLVVPNQVRVLVGDSATLHCGSSQPVSWSYESFLGMTIKNMLLRNGRHTLNKYSIVLNDLRSNETGFYQCLGYHPANRMFYQLAYVIGERA